MMLYFYFVCYCRDMVSVQLTGSRFKCKLPKRLAHFYQDFDPSNPNHMVTIELASNVNATTVKDKVIPMILSCKGNTGINIK